MGFNLPPIEIDSRLIQSMSWADDPEVILRLDDLFDTLEQPMTDFMRAIWPHHDDTPEWLALSLVAGFVKNFNSSRFVEGLDVQTSLHYSMSMMMANPSLQRLVADQMADMVSRKVTGDE